MSEPDFGRLDESHETPVTARARVLRYGSMVTQAELDLKRAREAEVEAMRILRKAKVVAQLSPDAPKVVRGGATVADKLAWVEQAVEDERFALDLATVMRQAAWDHYQRIDKQASLAQSILKSIDNSFGWGTGREQTPSFPR